MTAKLSSVFAEKFSTLDPKRRQQILLGGAGVVFLGLVFGGVALWDQQPAMQPVAPPKQELQAVQINPPGAPADPKEIWMAKSTDQMRQIEDLVKGLEKKVEGIDQKKLEEGTKPLIDLDRMVPIPPNAKQGNVPDPGVTIPPAGSTPNAGTPLAQEEVARPGISTIEVSDAGAVDEKVQAAAKDSGKSYLPSGSFFRIALLGGVDAPTGGQAQTNPHPILMRAQDNAFLPNQYRFKIKSCHLIGAATGDISSERALIRLESLSCIRTDGKAVDVPVKGYVVGEDGKNGFRGRLVTKQGQLLANALMAGIGAGIGQAFQQSATSYSTSAFGTVGTVDPNKQMQAGVGTGVGKALDRLAQFYITLAEKIFPVIEVDAARVGDVVLTKGVDLDMLTQGMDGDYSEIWKRGRAAQRKPLDPYSEY